MTTRRPKRLLVVSFLGATACSSASQAPASLPAAGGSAGSSGGGLGGAAGQMPHGPGGDALPGPDRDADSHDAPAILSDAALPHSVAELIVQAGVQERDHTIVSFAFPNGMGKSFLLRDGQNPPISLQVADDGTATFILPTLAAGKSETFRVEVPASAIPAGITAKKGPDDIQVMIGNATVLRFQARGQLPQGVAQVYLRGGYIHPIYTPGNVVVTDDYPPSHIHHHGIWSAWMDTRYNGHAVDFWNMAAGQGKVDFDALDGTWEGPVHAGLATRLVHLDLTTMQPTTVLRERWSVTAYKTHETAPYFVFDIHSSQDIAGNLPLVLNQALYGGFGFRGHRQWVTPANVSFATSEGFNRTAGDNTKGRWCAVYGTVDGKMGGYAVLGHPGNFRAPQTLRIHPDEPYFSFAPVKDSASSVIPGQTYVSRYRVVSFDGPADKTLLDRLWNDYATPPTVTVK